MFKRLTLLAIISIIFWSGAKREGALPCRDCKKYLNGTFVFSKDPTYFVVRTDTAIIEVINEAPQRYMVKYEVRWAANDCDHDLVFVRTTPRGLETTHKKGDFVHIQVKSFDDEKVSYTMTYKNKEPMEMVMYRIEP